MAARAGRQKDGGRLSILCSPFLLCNALKIKASQFVIDRLQYRMFTVNRMPEFDSWIESLCDRPKRCQLLRRLEKAQRGLLGDVAPVGEGVFAMREFFGPGWRMYYV